MGKKNRNRFRLETALFPRHFFRHRNATLRLARDGTPDDVSCLKEGQPVREAFTTVSKYWKTGRVSSMDDEVDDGEDETKELVIYDD